MWATIIAGIADISGVLAYWYPFGVMLDIILRSIATAVLGPPANTGGVTAAAIGLGLHFLVTIVFVIGYVLVAARVPLLKQRPVLFGLLYGLLAYVIMVFGVVPASLADFDGPWPPPPLNLAASLFIHLVLFGLPIGIVVSRMRD
jgi:uncharacterized membrane protein YagU involved in acid resistance